MKLSEMPASDLLAALESGVRAGPDFASTTAIFRRELLRRLNAAREAVAEEREAVLLLLAEYEGPAGASIDPSVVGAIRARGES